VEVVASGRVQRNVKPLPEPPLAFAVNEIDVAQADAVVIVTVGPALMVPVTDARGPSHPAALVQDTKNVVVTLRFGENVAPVLTTFPPDAASYHVSVPSQPPADRFTTPGPQRASPVVVGAAGIPLIVPVTGVRALSQPSTVHDTW